MKVSLSHTIQIMEKEIDLQFNEFEVYRGLIIPGSRTNKNQKNREDMADSFGRLQGLTYALRRIKRISHEFN